MTLRPIVIFSSLLILAGCLKSEPLHQSLNAPGKDFDTSKILVPGQYNLVHYYADWCPKCKNWMATMEAFRSRFADIKTHFVNIDSFESSVAQTHRIAFVPYFRLFDQSGKLVSEGKAAESWVRAEIDRRVGTGGRP